MFLDVVVISCKQPIEEAAKLSAIWILRGLAKMASHLMADLMGEDSGDFGLTVGEQYRSLGYTDMAIRRTSFRYRRWEIT